jgi:hypothetical protein
MKRRFDKMGTRNYLKQGDGFSVFFEMYEDEKEGVYLRLEGAPEAELGFYTDGSKQVTIKIPPHVWNEIIKVGVLREL